MTEQELAEVIIKLAMQSTRGDNGDCKGEMTRDHARKQLEKSEKEKI